MKAAVIDAFGGPDAIRIADVQSPTPGPGELLLRVSHAGVAVWDPLEREGAFAGLYKQLNGRDVTFPLVLGSEGTGKVVAVGEDVSGFAVGDEVYGGALVIPQGGFYAEHVAIDAKVVGRVPRGMPGEQAAAIGGDATTAVRGLEDVLKVKEGETVLIFGAGGGVGHMALQFAKRLGCRVFAVASRPTGVALALRLGADAAVDGRAEDVVAAAARFAPGGVDAALFTAGGAAAQEAVKAVKPGGRIAWPNGVDDPPKAPEGMRGDVFDNEIDPALMARVNEVVEMGPFEAHVAEVFDLERVAEAQRRVLEHHLGKIVLRIP
ncbi:zinc-binding dehydrogenase family oxidoreductase [Hyaloraphidium curvatum]|nr:zinc-binding dehydrogenase family oxidoreductase [Hyaloraphidium curvatum]